MRQTLFVLLVLGISTSIFADWGNFTGAELVQRCQIPIRGNMGKTEKKQYSNEQFLFDQGVCSGFMQGIKLMLKRTDINYPPEFPKSCIPEGIASTKLTDAIYDQINAAPHLLKLDATTLVVVSWSKWFPCSAK